MLREASVIWGYQENKGINYTAKGMRATASPVQVCAKYVFRCV